MFIPIYPMIFLLGFSLGVLAVKISNPEPDISLSALASTLVYHLVSTAIFYMFAVTIGLSLFESMISGLKSLKKDPNDTTKLKDAKVLVIYANTERNDDTNRHEHKP